MSEDEIRLVNDVLSDGRDNDNKAVSLPLASLFMYFCTGYSLQNRQKNGKKDDRPEGITAPEPRPMAPEILRRCALDGLQGNGIRGLDMLEITAISGLLGGHRPTMNTQGMFGSGRAEIGGFLGPILNFAHFGGIGGWK